MKSPSEQRFTPLELETRPTVDTAAYSYHMGIAQQTARIHACKETGPIRPIRIPGMAKLHWPVAEIRRVLNVAPLQKGFSTLSYLACIIGMALLAQAVLMLFPGILGSMDLAGVALLGAGVIGNSDSKNRRTHSYASQRNNEAIQREVAKMFEAREKAKHSRPEPDERPFLSSLGDCLVQTANYKPLGYAKITAVENDALQLHLEETTAAMFDAPVTIFIRAGVTPEHAREILKEAARRLKGYDTLEPWTPQEFLKSTPFDDDETIPF